MTRRVLLVAQAILAVSPALAEMPNPHVVPWTAHRGLVIGSDFEPQHFATAEISAPDGNGLVSVVITCENGQAGSGWSGYFTLLFRDGDTVLASTAELCQVDRQIFDLKQKKYSRTKSLDLSKILCHVDNVKTSITSGPLTIQSSGEARQPCSPNAGLRSTLRLASRAPVDWP
jgi:hypothetical protein